MSLWQKDFPSCLPQDDDPQSDCPIRIFDMNLIYEYFSDKKKIHRINIAVVSITRIDDIKSELILQQPLYDPYL